MNKKIIGILIMMLLIGTTYSVLGNDEKYEELNVNSSDKELLIDELDQYFYDMDYPFLFFGIYRLGQSFKPTLSTLSSVKIPLMRVGNPTGSLTVSIRSNLDGSNLRSKAISASSFPTGSPKWIDFNFADIDVTPEQTYYIVLTPDSSWMDYVNMVQIYFGYDYGDGYSRGTLWYYYDYYGYTFPWYQIGYLDLCFATYGYSNEPPKAYIDLITPNPAEQDTPVTFTGHGEDSDGTIQDYRWRSSIDGQIGTQPSFTTSTLSAGEHIIYFKVKDDDNDWSKEDTLILTITEYQSPTAYIDSITPNPAGEGAEVSFSGYGMDPDGTVEGYNWSSSIDGYLSNQTSFSTFSLTPGLHTIFFKVEDDGGHWSPEVTESLLISHVPEIPTITGPSTGEEGTEYIFNISSTDADDDMIKYVIDWGDTETEITGYYNSGVLVTVNHIWDEKEDYIIKVKAVDENDIESDWGTLEISIPKSKSYANHWLTQFFENYQNIFTIIKQLLGIK